jgi:hypothetical protein
MIIDYVTLHLSNLYVVIMFKSNIEVYNNYRVKSGDSNNNIILVACYLSLHVYNCIVIIYVVAENSKYLLLIESDVGFHNIVVSNLFNYMRVNETAYVIIVIKLINNKLVSQDSQWVHEASLAF